jgi:transposase
MRRGPNISIRERDQVIGMLRGGSTVQEVAQQYGRNDRTIQKIRQKFNQTSTTADKPRSGRPPVLSLKQKKIIYRKARATPKIEYLQLIEEAIFVNADGTPSKPPSRSTLYRYLKR